MDNNTIPNLSIFLDKIDPEKTIDRALVVIEIGNVVLAKSLEEVSENLTPDQKSELVNKANTQGDKLTNNYIEYLKEIGKFEEYAKILDKVTLEVRDDYIKTQIEALDQNKKDLLFLEFPALKNL